MGREGSQKTEADSYLENDANPEPNIANHFKAIEINDAGDWLEPAQEVTNLWK